jgi:hypothetical protein
VASLAEGFNYIEHAGLVRFWHAEDAHNSSVMQPLTGKW